MDTQPCSQVLLPKKRPWERGCIFFNKYSLSLYVYTRGLLGCLGSKKKNQYYKDLQILQDGTRRWRSSKATKQTRTRRCKTFKCCKMLLEDQVDDKTRPRGCKYPTPPCALAKIFPETTRCAPSFVKSRMLRPLQTHS